MAVTMFNEEKKVGQRMSLKRFGSRLHSRGRSRVRARVPAARGRRLVVSIMVQDVPATSLADLLHVGEDQGRDPDGD